MLSFLSRTTLERKFLSHTSFNHAYLFVVGCIKPNWNGLYCIGGRPSKPLKVLPLLPLPFGRGTSSSPYPVVSVVLVSSLFLLLLLLSVLAQEVHQGRYIWVGSEINLSYAHGADLRDALGKKSVEGSFPVRSCSNQVRTMTSHEDGGNHLTPIWAAGCGGRRAFDAPSPLTGHSRAK